MRSSSMLMSDQDLKHKKKVFKNQGMSCDVYIFLPRNIHVQIFSIELEPRRSDAT